MIRHLNKNDLGKYVNAKYWSDIMIECYEKGCVCRNCAYSPYFVEDKCQVKATVLEAVRKFGKPFERTKVVIGE